MRQNRYWYTIVQVNNFKGNCQNNVHLLKYASHPNDQLKPSLLFHSLGRKPFGLGTNLDRMYSVRNLNPAKDDIYISYVCEDSLNAI